MVDVFGIFFMAFPIEMATGETEVHEDMKRGDPSGKLLHNELEHQHASWINQRPCSMAKCKRVYQRAKKW